MGSSTVDGAALAGSPLTTAIFAPLGKTAGAGPQCNTVGFAAGAACECSVAAATSRRQGGTARTRMGPPMDREWCDQDGAAASRAEERGWTLALARSGGAGERIALKLPGER